MLLRRLLSSARASAAFALVQFATSILAPSAVAAPAPVDFKIVTASERGTYLQIGRDLARFVAPDALSADVP